MNINRLSDNWKRDTINSLQDLSNVEDENEDVEYPDVTGDFHHTEKYLL